jgi:hypothetical protein
MPTIAGRAAPITAPAWAGFMAVLLGAAAALYLAGLGFILAVDPYDTGRTGLLGRHGVPEQLPHSANASRARDPRFDAAIFGNSHVQALRPERLDLLTGLHVVTLMMPGSYPADQLDTLRWYLAVKPRPRAIVIGADEFWCFETTERSTVFPVWLYAPGFAEYLAGLASYKSLRESLKRLAFLRKGRGGARPDGYWDYAEIYSRFGARDENLRVLLEKPKPYRVNASGSFPSLDALAALVTRIPAQTALVLLRPPAFRTAIPEPGTPEGRTAAACLDRLERIAASRPRTRLLDLFRRSPANDDPANFYDWLHYRERYAMEIERQIAEALREIGLPPSAN